MVFWKAQETYLEREILVWSHETDALEMVGNTPSSLFLRESGEGRTSSTLAFANICSKGGTIGLVKGTGTLVVHGAERPSCTCTPKETAAPSITTSKGSLRSRAEKSSTRGIVIVVGVAEATEASRSTGSGRTAAKKPPTSCTCRCTEASCSILAKWSRAGSRSKPPGIAY